MIEYSKYDTTVSGGMSMSIRGYGTFITSFRFRVHIYI